MADLGEFRGTGGRDPDGQVVAAELAGGVGELPGRADDPGAETVGDDDRSGHQGQPYAAQCRPGDRHVPVEVGRGDEHLDHRDAFATHRHRLQVDHTVAPRYGG